MTVEHLLYSREGTSRDAAEEFEPRRLTVREQVFQYIEASGGATDDEVSLALDKGLNTVRPRRYELEHAGRVMDSGQRRKTENGRDAIVWIVPPVEPKQLSLITGLTPEPM